MCKELKEDEVLATITSDTPFEKVIELASASSLYVKGASGWKKISSSNMIPELTEYGTIYCFPLVTRGDTLWDAFGGNEDSFNSLSENDQSAVSLLQTIQKTMKVGLITKEETLDVIDTLLTNKVALPVGAEDVVKFGDKRLWVMKHVDEDGQYLRIFEYQDSYFLS